MKKTLLFVGSVIILILAAVTFIFIPALAQSVPGKAIVFGKYDGKAIELSQGSAFANAVANYESAAKSDLSQLGSMTEEQQDYYRNMIYYNIYNNAFSATIFTLAYRNAVEKSGWQPSEMAVSRAMVPYFTDEFGRFSERAYNATSESNRTALKTDITNQLIWQRFTDDTFGATTRSLTNEAVPVKLGDSQLFGLKRADAELTFLAEQGAKKRSFTMAAFSTANYPDTEVIAYGKEHSELFTRYDLSVITVDEEADAKKLLSQLTNEELAFADAVSEYSEKYYSDSEGKVNAAYKYQLKTSIPNEADVESLSSLQQDALSAVIKTNNGYSIFRADGSVTAPDFTAEDNSDLLTTVRNYIKANESGLIEDYYLGIAKNFAASAVANGFDAACTDFETEAIDVPAFTLNYGNTSIYGSLPSITQLSGAATNDNFLKTAFSLTAGEVSEPIVLGSNVLVLKMTGEQTDEVSDEVKATLPDTLAGYDQSSAQTALLSSDKVENNVYETFYKYFMTNR